MDASDFMMADAVPEPPPDDGPAPLLDDRRRSQHIPESNPDAGLPANLEAEKVVLAAILLDNAAFSEVAERLEADDFSLDSHRRIFLRMAELIDAQKAVDTVTLIDELSRHKEVEAVGGVGYITDLTTGVPRRPAISNYVAILKDKSMLRKLMGICSMAIARAADQSETAMEVLEAAESQLLEIAQDANTGKLRTIYQSVEEAGGTEPYLKAYTQPELKPGLQTGFLDYDRMTGGLQKSELTIWAARPSMGKTAIAMNLIENVCCGTNRVVAFFSLEMSREAIERRFMAARARVNVKRAMEGFFLSSDEKWKLEQALGDLVESGIFIDDSSSLTPVQMRAKARRLKQREKRLDLVVCDYLQLLSAGTKTGNRQEEIALISRSLKAMAKELETSVVALAQLNRSPDQRQDKRPVLSDLRESGQIEQDGDVIAFIHRGSYYDRDNEDLKGLAELLIGKSRNGPTGVVKLAFDETITRFDNLARS
jgi:replicative DNA helicase